MSAVVERETHVAERLVKADAVADVLSIKPCTVRDLSRRQNDPMPSLKIGASRRWRLSDVLAWVDAEAGRS